eukprot:1826364-Rhodomonas_salina.1
MSLRLQSRSASALHLPSSPVCTPATSSPLRRAAHNWASVFEYTSVALSVFDSEYAREILSLSFEIRNRPNCATYLIVTSSSRAYRSFSSLGKAAPCTPPSTPASRLPAPSAGILVPHKSR